MSHLLAPVWSLLGYRPGQQLVGKHAVVAGGGGIASDLVQLLLDGGLVVHVIDKNARNLSSLRKRMKLKPTLYTYQVDMTDEAEFESVSNSIKSSALPDHVSILVHTAAVVNHGSVECLSLKQRRRIFDINVLTWYSCMRFFLPEMKSSREGHIVTFSSVVAYGAGSSASDYCGTKAALLAMHNSLRLELIRDGFSTFIHTTIIHPYIVDTELFAKADLKMKWLLPRLTAEHVARATFDGIVYQQETVFVPRMVLYMCMVASISPIWFQDILYKLTGAVDFMKGPSDGEDF